MCGVPLKSRIFLFSVISELYSWSCFRNKAEPEAQKETLLPSLTSDPSLPSPLALSVWGLSSGREHVSGRGGTSASFRDDDLSLKHTPTHTLWIKQEFTHPPPHHFYLSLSPSFNPIFSFVLPSFIIPFFLSHDPTLLRPLFTSRSPSLSPCLLLSYGLAAELITKAN